MHGRPFKKNLTMISVVLYGKKYDFDTTSNKKFNESFHKVKKEIEKLKKEEEEENILENQENNIIFDCFTPENIFQFEDEDYDLDEFNQYFLLDQNNNDSLCLS